MILRFIRTFCSRFTDRVNEEPDPGLVEPVESLDTAGNMLGPILREYGYTTVESIENASVEELAALDSVPQGAAARIYREAAEGIVTTPRPASPRAEVGQSAEESEPELTGGAVDLEEWC